MMRRPRTCSRCNAPIDQWAVLTVTITRTPDGLVMSPHHVCPLCLTREAAEEIEAARQSRHATQATAPTART